MKGVSIKFSVGFQGSLKEVQRIFQRSFKDVSRKFQDVSKKLLGCCKKVLMVFQGRLMGA